MSKRVGKLAFAAAAVIVIGLGTSTPSHAIYGWYHTTKAVYNAWGQFVGYRQDLGPTAVNPLKDVLIVESWRLSAEWDPSVPVTWTISYVAPFTGTGIPAASGPGFYHGLEGIALEDIGDHFDTYMIEAPFAPGTHGPAMRFFAGPGDYVLARNSLTGERILYGPDEIEEVVIVPEPASLAVLAAMLPLAAGLRRRR